MPDITDPDAIRFCNEKVRPSADQLTKAYYQAKRVVNEWHAAGLSAKITNTSDAIVDGSATDGRKPITGADATNIITRLSEFITDYESGSNAKLNTVLKVEVNGGS